MKLKIVKRFHYYSGNEKEEYLIYRKSLLNGWKRSDDEYYPIQPFKKGYSTYKDAEIDILNYFKKDLGGIVEVDGNVYTFYPLSLPTP